MSSVDQSRRDSVKKLGLAAGAAWVAPVVTGIVVPRHASATSASIASKFLVHVYDDGLDVDGITIIEEYAFVVLAVVSEEVNPDNLAVKVDGFALTVLATYPPDEASSIAQAQSLVVGDGMKAFGVFGYVDEAPETFVPQLGREYSIVIENSGVEIYSEAVVPDRLPDDTIFR